LEDKDLVAEYKLTGDQQIAAKLFTRYDFLVYGVCLKYLKNPEDATDVVQDIYLQVVKKLKTHNVEAFRPWLYVLSKNHCLDILRKKNRTDFQEFNPNIVYSDQIFHPDEVHDDSMMVKLMNCLEGLPSDQKECVQQFYFDKKSYKEISDESNKNLNQVRSHIQNGRRNLKICMEK
jgi:RNA polymerase sigma factor (sigma-70 family)